MKPKIQNLLREISSPEKKISSEAILRIAMILEMNTLAKSEHQRVGYYDSYILPWSLIFVTLNRQEQAEITQQLYQIFVSQDISGAGIFWAFQKTEEIVALAPLLKIIEECYHRLTEEQIEDILSALYECLANASDSWVEIDLEIQSLFQKPQVVKFLEDNGVSVQL
ncbi:MAG: hypothetical protein J7519_11605 [Roseofilum sp. SID1]|uniref:hypothetical protein n=1 Tax=Roseofilum sp. SID1 TaxID=2821497 RepID=UPI001B063C31|nr:hypothetical protein [Roseofilum sp. SID1]MBP0038334.1 hypothetical protein [Roseofilum sp. SID1]